MENVVLVHHGTKGMRWGIRRYQNKDGSLTPAGKKRYDKEMAKLTAEKKKLRNQERTKAKLAKLKATQDEIDAKKKSLQEESDAERKARVLKSTDAAEIYKNRHLLTTNELNDRINRINAESRLADMAESTKTTAMDRVDKILKVGRKINEVYEFTNTPVMKSIKKKLFGDKVDKAMDLKTALGKLDKLSDKELQEVINRGNNEKKLKKLLEDASGDKSKDSNKKSGIDVEELADLLKERLKEE